MYLKTTIMSRYCEVNFRELVVTYKIIVELFKLNRSIVQFN